MGLVLTVSPVLPTAMKKVKSLAEIMCHLGKLSRAGAKFAFARQISAEPEEGDLCSCH